MLACRWPAWPMAIHAVLACKLFVTNYSMNRMGQTSEEHTSELQSPCNLVCRLLLEKETVLVIRLRSLRLLRVSGIVMRLRMFLLLITFLKASHSFRNRLLVICKNAYLFATMIMTSVSSPFSCCFFLLSFDSL